MTKKVTKNLQEGLQGSVQAQFSKQNYNIRQTYFLLLLNSRLVKLFKIKYCGPPHKATPTKGHLSYQMCWDSKNTIQPNLPMWSPLLNSHLNEKVTFSLSCHRKFYMNWTSFKRLPVLKGHFFLVPKGFYCIYKIAPLKRGHLLCMTITEEEGLLL
jgi:hypothetical protein